MGSNISTMNPGLAATNAVLSSLGISSKEALIGIIIATPIFIHYFILLREHYLHKNNNKALPQHVSVTVEDKESQQKVHAAIRELEQQRDSLSWGAPEPMLLSPFSSATPSLQGSASVDDFRIGSPPTIFQDDLEDGDDTIDFAPLLPKSPELVDPSDAKTSPLLFKRMPEEQAPKATERDYLESVASLLYSKAKQVVRSDKIGISEALFQLGEILFQDAKYASAQRVLHKTERLQKKIIHETLVAVGNAMRQQADYYQEHGLPELAQVYQHTAFALSKESAGAQDLSQAWEIHVQVGKKVMHEREELRVILKKVEHRLKRASKEAKALSATLRMEADSVQQMKQADGWMISY